MEGRYDDLVKARRRARGPAAEDDSELFDNTELGPLDESFGQTDKNAMSSSDVTSGGATAGKAMSSGVSEKEALAGGLMATGNPYAVAAGAGLAVLSAKEKRKEQEELQRYQARQDRIQRQQQALDKLIGISNSMRQL